MMGADEDATHECGGQRFVPVEHHRDAHRKIKTLTKAVRWALGEEGDFESRKDGDPPYWWRKKLRHFARLEES